MFTLFKHKSVKPDLSFLGADMHSHLLPALDDGLKTMDDTIRFIHELHEMGYEKLICTPHIMSDLYPNSPGTILPALEKVRKEVRKQNIPVEIEAAAEYMVDFDMEKKLNENKPLLTFGKKYILIEMSFVAPSPNIEQVIFQLRMKGLQPVMAHPERYNYYHNQVEKYDRFIEMGCLMQLNLLSLSGYYGKPVKAIAEKLLAAGKVDLLGTDMHHENHLNSLKEMASRKEFYELFEETDIKNRKLLF